MPRRRVSVAVVPKFNALNLPGQAPSSSPIPSLPALVSIMSPASVLFYIFLTPPLRRGCRWGQGQQRQEISSREYGWRSHKATQHKPCHCSETCKLSTEGSGGVPQNSHPFEQKHNSLRRGCLKKPASKLCRVQWVTPALSEARLWSAESKFTSWVSPCLTCCSVVDGSPGLINRISASKLGISP